MSSEVRFGNVSSIDYEAGKCEVTYPDRDDTVTEMVPFLSNGEYQTPEVDDLVLVLHPGESPEDAVVVGTVWNEKNKPPEGKEKVYRKDYANSRGKAYRKFDANAKELTDYVDGKKILKAKSLEIQVGGATVTISEGGEIKVTSYRQQPVERGNLAAHHHLPALVQYGMGVVHLSAHHQRLSLIHIYFSTRIEFNSNSIPLISTVFHPVKANMES